MQLNQRYLKFDLEQLLKTAVAAVSGEGARCCKFASHSYLNPAGGWVFI